MHTRGMQWELLQNGIKREDLEVDSEIDKTGSNLKRVLLPFQRFTFSKTSEYEAHTLVH